jgi:hypothetical protein
MKHNNLTRIATNNLKFRANGQPKNGLLGRWSRSMIVGLIIARFGGIIKPKNQFKPRIERFRPTGLADRLEMSRSPSLVLAKN